MTDDDLAEDLTAAALAERALLGALLWDPHRAHDVAGWLRGEDFTRPAHAAIYQTITGLQADGERVDLRFLPQVLAAGRYHDLHVARDGTGPVGAAALHELLSMTPATPRHGDGPIEQERSEHVRYARIVLDGSIRRQLDQLGTRVGQHAAALADIPTDAAGEHLEVTLAEAETRLDELAARRESAERDASPIIRALDPHAGPTRHRRTGAADLPAAAAHPDGVGLAQIGTLPRRHPPSSRELHAAEHQLLAAAISCPPVRRHLEDRLQPGDFLGPQVGATWHAIQTLRRQGEPVDVVLVAAQVERQGVHPTLGAGLRPGTLLALHVSRPDIVQGYRAAKVVLRASLTRAAAHAAGQLHALGEPGGRSSRDVLNAARAALHDVAGTVRRLNGAGTSGAMAALTPPQRNRSSSVVGKSLPDCRVSPPLAARGRPRG